jgi:hypothetical protein
MDIRVKTTNGIMRPVSPPHQRALSLLTGGQAIENEHIIALNLLGIELIESVSAKTISNHR